MVCLYFASKLPSELVATLLLVCGRFIDDLYARFHDLKPHLLQFFVYVLDRAAAPSVTAEGAGNTVFGPEALQIRLKFCNSGEH